MNGIWKVSYLLGIEKVRNESVLSFYNKKMFSFFLDLMKLNVGLILLILICIYETSSFFYISSKMLTLSDDPDYQDFVQRFGQSTRNIEIDPELFKQKVLEKLSEMKKQKLKNQKHSQLAKFNRLMSG